MRLSDTKYTKLVESEIGTSMAIVDEESNTEMTFHGSEFLLLVEAMNYFYPHLNVRIRDFGHTIKSNPVTFEKE